MNNGFIVIYRSLLEWEWYSDANTLRLFLHCLLRANHKDRAWQGITIERGSFVTSYQHLALDLGLTVQKIRTSINKLKSTGEITHKSHGKYGVITINNYDKYQEINSQPNTQATVNQQASNNKQQRNKETMKQDIKPIGVALQEMIEAYTTNPDLRKTLQEFVQHRNSSAKTKLSELAMTKNLKELDRLFDNDNDKIQSIDQTIANNWKGVFLVGKQGKKDDKVTYTWQAELKAEQDAHDAKEYQPKRSAEELKEGFDKL